MHHYKSKLKKYQDEKNNSTPNPISWNNPQCTNKTSKTN